MKAVRCAIYTHKSSEEGLEQSFNSLDAQREACAAYILSQASEGWAEVKKAYDDGGISGSTLERPGLKALMADVAAGEIDIIVVYKVDRLTRSLLDFARLVEALDKAGVSFVSVTQAFNTTTSMGRLTLNMLLSFAQFEREVTAERIRDKIAASKAKGMWMGGIPPLGYKPNGRSLAIVEEHAAIVRDIHKRYVAIGNVRLLAGQLAHDGVHNPVRTTGSGKTLGGSPFTRGQLYRILQSRIYLGEIVHGDLVYPGLHPAIVDRALWDRVQARLADNLQGARAPTRARNPSLMAGLLEDGQGKPLIATHANGTSQGEKEGARVRYRYYVSKGLHHRTKSISQGGAMRIPARELEIAVAERLARAFDDPLALAQQAGLPVGIDDVRHLDRHGSECATRLRSRDRTAVRSLLRSVRVEPNRIILSCPTQAVSHALGLEDQGDPTASIQLVSDVRLTRSGRAMRLKQGDGTLIGADPDTMLVKLLSRAHRYWHILRTEQIDITRLAEREKISATLVTRMLRLAFLSPLVVETVVKGRHKARMGSHALLATDAIHPLWDKQHEAFLGAG